MDIYLIPFILFASATILSLSTLHSQLPYSYTHQSIQVQFKSWQQQFNIQFSTQQEPLRFKIFTINLLQVNLHNSQLSNTYSLALNQFAHLTHQEFNQIILQKSPKHLQLFYQPSINLSYIDLSKVYDIDWQTLGKISQVKNQGNCNAGYAFSTTGLIQTSLMMENQNYLLSEQQIIDCAFEYGGFGCQGGSRQGALRYSQQKGIDIAMQYPYTGSKGICKTQKGTIIPDFTLAKAEGCDQIRQRLYISPLTVGVNAKNWQLYSTGIFNNCPSTSEVNHQTLLVGVTLSYWRLKNSWGSRWGESGYIRIKLGDNCGICQRPAYGFSI